MLGKIFGDLTVVDKAEPNYSKRKNGSIREIRKWKCRCVCGEEYIAFESKLKSEKTTSCGCAKNRKRIGLTFGDLTIIGYENKIGKTNYICKCVCGNEKKFKFNDLSSGRVKSCGCYKKRNSKVKPIKKNSKILHAKRNTYIVRGKVLEIYDARNNKMLIDTNNFHFIKGRYISLNGGGYATFKENNKTLLLHKVLMNDVENKKIIDHINRDRHDNRMSNLRIVTISENKINSKVRKDNTSGVTGVFWKERDKKWYVTLSKNNKKIYLGYFKELEEAIICRLKGELYYYGKDFAPQRHLFEKYKIK